MSTETKNCPMCGEEILAVAVKCRHCKSFLDPAARPVEDTSGTLERLVIPVGRPGSAIAAGYMGLLSFFPCLGLPCGIMGIVFGMSALKQIKENPHLSGKGRAWFGIIAGVPMTIVWGILVVIAIIGAIAEANK